MRKLVLICSVLWIWTCGGGGGGSSPTEPNIQLPTVQNIEFTLAEDTSKTFAFMGSDPLNRALTYSVSTQPQHGTLTINAGAGTYTPNANYHGADTFAYIATNVDGTSNIGTIIATITPVDDEPNSMDVTATTDEDNAIDITLEAEEVDGDNIEFQVRNNPSYGSVTISGTTATYTPNQDWNGTDTFNFEAVDSNARSVLNVATATIIVNPVNDAPVAEDIDVGEIQLNESIDITLKGSDVDNDNLTYSIVSQPSNGTVTINGAIATYTTSSLGEDNFSYQASDGTYTSNERTISATIISTKTFGGENFEVANSVIQTSDGGYLLGGVTNSFGNGENDMYLVKTDASGTEEWSQTFGGTANDYAYSVIQTSDGGYLLGGYTSSFGNGTNDMYLVKTDASGTEEWYQTFGETTVNAFAHSILQTSDEGYLLGGYKFGGFGNQGSDMYLVKTHASGTEEWSQTFGGAENDVAYSVIQTSDGGYLLGGYTRSFGSGDSDMYIVKTDASGTEEWSQTFGGAEIDIVYSVIQTSDGGYLLGGFTRSFGSGMYIVKTDASGTEEWSQTFGRAEYDKAYSVIQTSDGGYLLGGNTIVNGTNDMYLIKTDANGTEEWYQTFGGRMNDYAYSILQTSDGGYLLGGNARSFGSGYFDMYLVKTDSEGNQEW